MQARCATSLITQAKAEETRDVNEISKVEPNRA